ncbi:MAG: N-6 DNA methylase [Desulfobacteraceae bacterium]|nr:N-6 DNA methylase [Desulfobacteraceae bacterium]
MALFEALEEVFLVHSYLSIFSKIIGYCVLEPDKFIDDRTLHGIIRGDIFTQLNISNFIDNDFYHWAASQDNFEALVPAFRKIIQQTDQYDFGNIREDILKGMYQELIDLDTRHVLGEYYTPDWLCEKIVSELNIGPDSMILDPACGSGSFLRAAIDRLKTEYPEMTADDIAQKIVGIDIHPLSVQISKNTILLALGEKLRSARRPVTLRVFLANTLFVPEGSIELFENVFKLMIDKQIYHIDMQIFENPTLFDEAIDVCSRLVEISETRKFSRIDFTSIFRKFLKAYELSEEIVKILYDLQRTQRSQRTRQRQYMEIHFAESVQTLFSEKLL